MPTPSVDKETADQILSKHGLTGPRFRSIILSAMREIASLAWDAGYRRRHDEWLKTDGETISAPDKETYLTKLFEK